MVDNRTEDICERIFRIHGNALWNMLVVDIIPPINFGQNLQLLMIVIIRSLEIERQQIRQKRQKHVENEVEVVI
jgi:hypothetical protein